MDMVNIHQDLNMVHIMEVQELIHHNKLDQDIINLDIINLDIINQDIINQDMDSLHMAKLVMLNKADIKEYLILPMNMD